MKEDTKETGLRLLKKGRQGILRVVFSRSGLILVLLLYRFCSCSVFSTGLKSFCLIFTAEL